jgi:hypothetical protein
MIGAMTKGLDIHFVASYRAARRLHCSIALIFTTKGIAQPKRACAPLDVRCQRRAALLNLRRCAMRENLRPGEKFPDIELVNENDQLTKLSSLMRSFPTAMVFSRGYY